ncbi:MAG: hypothetical protein AB1717_10785 [Pseudomonadota bacterium]
MQSTDDLVDSLLEDAARESAHQAEQQHAGDAATEPPEDKSSQASKLVAFVLDHCELFHDENRDAFATLNGSGLTYRLDGRVFKDWLAASFYSAEGKSPRGQSVTEAIGTLSGIARHEREQQAVFLRVGMADAAYFIDLCEPKSSRAIELRPGSWRIADAPPIRFMRTEAMQPLPAPTGKGDLSKLWDVTNIPADKRVLIVAWLIDALRPDTPFPVLELGGEAGSAKSTTQAILRSLIDPNAANLRTPPKAVDDCFVAAGVSWVVSYENVSHLPAPLQDALCVLATGGGFAKRKLYSDADESVINVKRPVILNGISANVTAHDLADRAISIELPVVENRAESSNVWHVFTQHQADIIAGLMTLAARALAILPNIQVPAHERPRMLEFYSLGLAVGEVLKRDFKAQYLSTRHDAASRSIESSPVAAALVEWFEVNKRQAVEMPAKQLMQAVEHYKPEYAEAWPKSPRGFADALRRAAPSLRQVGIEVKQSSEKSGHDNVRTWRVERKKFQTTSALSATSANHPPHVDMADIADVKTNFSRTDSSQNDEAGNSSHASHGEEF